MGSLFVLVNAIYFKAKWADEFNERSTEDDLFYTPGGYVTVPMMSQWCYVNYSEDDNYQAAGIPHMGNNVEMLVLLPKTGSFQQVEASLTPEQLDKIVADSENQEVVLKLPKFECRPDSHIRKINMTVISSYNPKDRQASIKVVIPYFDINQKS